MWDDKLTNGVSAYRQKDPKVQNGDIIRSPQSKKVIWDSYKEALHGSYVDDLVTSQPQMLKAIEEARIPKEPPLTPKQCELRSVVNGEMWNGKLPDGGDAKITHVSLGQAVVFKMPLENGKILHIVDNPGDGAIYLFDNYKDAEKRQVAI